LPIVSNASPLIWLFKVGRLSLLEKLFSEVLIPEEVYRKMRALKKAWKKGSATRL
jgi:predicted nucleic acid-binding protein